MFKCVLGYLGFHPWLLGSLPQCAVGSDYQSMMITSKRHRPAILQGAWREIEPSPTLGKQQAEPGITSDAWVSHGFTWYHGPSAAFTLGLPDPMEYLLNRKMRKIRISRTCAFSLRSCIPRLSPHDGTSRCGGLGVLELRNHHWWPLEATTPPVPAAPRNSEVADYRFPVLLVSNRNHHIKNTNQCKIILGYIVQNVRKKSQEITASGSLRDQSTLGDRSL